MIYLLVVIPLEVTLVVLPLRVHRIAALMLRIRITPTSQAFSLGPEVSKQGKHLHLRKKNISRENAR